MCFHPDHLYPAVGEPQSAEPSAVSSPSHAACGWSRSDWEICWYLMTFELQRDPQNQALQPLMMDVKK